MADRFVWYELMTTDAAAATAFYGKVVGWGTQEGPVPDMPYTILTAGETPVGGLMAQPEEARRAGAPPMWIGYVGVADVDATAVRAAELGGSVLVSPTDIPNVGRFAVLADPHGAVFALWACSGTPPAPPPPRTPGLVGWHELLAGDGQAAFAFYAALFGWTKADAMDMGAMGVYQLFAAGGDPVGGMFTKPPAVPKPFWQFYVNVGDIDTAAAQVAEAGGKVMMGPMEVPGGGWIIQATDPQGAMFALLGTRKS